MTLAQIIRARRDAQNLTLEEVADAAGCSKSHLHGLESGKHINPGIVTCVRLGIALGIPMQLLAAAALESNLAKEPSHDQH